MGLKELGPILEGVGKLGESVRYTGEGQANPFSSLPGFNVGKGRLTVVPPGQQNLANAMALFGAKQNPLDDDLKRAQAEYYRSRAGRGGGGGSLTPPDSPFKIK